MGPVPRQLTLGLGLWVRVRVMVYMVYIFASNVGGSNVGGAGGVDYRPPNGATYI